MSNSLSVMPFNPKGYFKATREKEYDSYCQGIEDVMDLLAEEHRVTYQLRGKVLSLVVVSADDFT